MSEVSLVAQVYGAYYLNSGDTVTRDFEETFELMVPPSDILQKMIAEIDRPDGGIEEAVYIYSYWLANLPGTEVRLSSDDHYLEDPEGPTPAETFATATLESLHLKALDKWVSDHLGWHVFVQVNDNVES